MAVRHEEQSTPRDQASPGLPWKKALEKALDNLPALVLVGGLLMYFFLTMNYNVFYGSLGVDPNDVGLSYAGRGIVKFCGSPVRA